MKLTRTAAAIVAGTAFAALSFAAAAPAYAADDRSLPAGYSLYTFGCESDAPLLSSVNPAGAVATAVGTATSADECGELGSWNPVTHLGYYVDTDNGRLKSVDVATGVATDLGELTLDGLPGRPQMLAIGNDGAAYAGVYEGPGILSLYSVNLTTRVLTLIGTNTDVTTYYEALSVDPNTGAFYALSYDGTTASVDTSTGAFTALPTAITFDAGFDMDDSDIYSLSIDSNGIWWINNDHEDDGGNWHSSLWSYDPAQTAVAALYSGDFTTDANDPAAGFDSFSTFVAPTNGVPPVITPAVVTPAAPVPAPKPMLAETGVDSAQVGTLGFSAIAALLLGAGLFTAGRSRRKARA